ncbi:MAG TPA: hypothetical protein VK187_05410 [Geobacteraceae bacterium]|nr:hypothetical protein [Geobacteraceae bacterium]
MPDAAGPTDRLQKWFILALGVIAVAIIGYIDYLTGDYSILIFYLFPISLVSWFAGCWRGMLVASLSGLTRFLADYTVVTNMRLLYWNSIEDAIFLMFVAGLIFFLRKALRSSQE